MLARLRVQRHLPGQRCPSMWLPPGPCTHTTRTKSTRRRKAVTKKSVVWPGRAAHRVQCAGHGDQVAHVFLAVARSVQAQRAPWCGGSNPPSPPSVPAPIAPGACTAGLVQAGFVPLHAFGIDHAGHQRVVGFRCGAAPRRCHRCPDVQRCRAGTGPRRVPGCSPPRRAVGWLGQTMARTESMALRPAHDLRGLIIAA